MALIAGAILASGCAHEPISGASEALRPVSRLVDLGFRTHGDGVRRQAPVSISDVFRPAFAGSESRSVPYSCGKPNAAGVRRCTARIPQGWETAGILEVRPGPGAPASERLWFEVRPNAPMEFDLPPGLGKRKKGEGKGGVATLHSAPSIAKRTVTTDPVLIADGAVLRFSVGVETPAWDLEEAGVRFSIEVDVEGSASPLFETTLDPAENPADRIWREESVALDAWSDETVSFVFRTESSSESGEGISLPVWGDPTIYAPRAAPADAPWIVLVSLDTLRARSMSLYGREHRTTPYLEELASRGTAFARAFTTFPKTHGSHMSIFSSLLPHRHGVFGGVRSEFPAESRAPMLSERLRSAGWRTVAFTENGLLDGRLFSRGYDRYEESKFVALDRGEARETFARTLEWLEVRADEGPFYVFVHTYEVHGPYHPAEEYQGMWPEIGPSSLRSYEQETRGLDDLLRDFVPRLEALAGARGLLLVVFADHGEEFFEHGGVDHGKLFDEVMHVPLIFHWPRHVAAGRVVKNVVSVTDISPTVLDLLGLPAFVPADGRSLAGLLRPEAEALSGAIAFGQMPRQPSNEQTWQFIARSAVGKCFSSTRPEHSYCFDLVTDPAEKVRIPFGAPNHPLSALQLEAERYRLEAMAAMSQGRAGGANKVSPSAVDPARARKLRALGYIED